MKSLMDIHSPHIFILVYECVLDTDFSLISNKKNIEYHHQYFIPAFTFKGKDKHIKVHTCKANSDQCQQVQTNFISHFLAKEKSVNF